MRDSDFVVLAAGIGRKPGMTRMDLLKVNANIVKDVASKIATYAKNSKLIVVTNPLDPMTYLTLKTTGIEKKSIMGMGGMLDLSRFKNFIQDVTKVSRDSIQAMVISEHGENMLPLIRFSSPLVVSRLTNLFQKKRQEKYLKIQRKSQLKLSQQRVPLFLLQVML